MLERRCVVTCFCNPKTCFRIQNQSPPKRRELSILIDTNSPTVLKSRFKKWKAGILSQKMLFPPCVVVNFFFDEEERRYAITRRRRKEHKKRRNSPAQVKTPVLEPPLSVLSQLFSFIHLPCGRRDTKIDLYLQKRKKANDEEKSSHPSTHYHRWTSIDDSNACDFLARVRARTQKKKWYYMRAQMRANAREKVKMNEKKCF